MLFDSLSIVTAAALVVQMHTYANGGLHMQHRCLPLTASCQHHLYTTDCRSMSSSMSWT